VHVFTLSTLLYSLRQNLKYIYIYIYIKVKWSRYSSGVAQRVGRGIALPFHDRGTRRGWVVSSTPRPHFTPGKDPVPILQEAGRVPGSVWTGGKSRSFRDSNPDRPARSSVATPNELPGPPHPITNHAQRCSTAVIGREPMFSTLHGLIYIYHQIYK